MIFSLFEILYNLPVFYSQRDHLRAVPDSKNQLSRYMIYFNDINFRLIVESYPKIVLLNRAYQDLKYCLRG